MTHPNASASGVQLIREHFARIDKLAVSVERALLEYGKECKELDTQSSSFRKSYPQVIPVVAAHLRVTGMLLGVLRKVADLRKTQKEVLETLDKEEEQRKAQEKVAQREQARKSAQSHALSALGFTRGASASTGGRFSRSPSVFSPPVTEEEEETLCPSSIEGGLPYPSPRLALILVRTPQRSLLCL